MAAEVGYAALGIFPSFTGFRSQLERGVRGDMVRVGATGGQMFGDAAGSSAGKRFGGRFSSVLKAGGLFAGIGAAMGVTALIKDSVQLEATFSKTMAQIRVATGASADELARLDRLAIKLGKDTVFSANEASEAMLELAKNGISTAQIEAGALNSALTLAAAGSVELTDAAMTMGNALNAFGIKAEKSASVAAALAGAANASSASVGSIAEGLQQTSAVAADAGFSLQETTAALAAFANAGIGGSDAGTSLKTAITRLIPTTAKARGVMQQYGLMTFDAVAASKDLASMGLKPLGKGYEGVYKAIEQYLVQQGVAKEGTVGLAKAVDDYLVTSGIMRSDFLKSSGDFRNLAAIAGELETAFADLSDSERAAALNTLFGSDARRAATVLMNEGADGLRKYTKATSDQAAAERMAAANMEGTAGAMERLSGAWETVRLQMGKFIAPLAADLMEGLANALEGLSNFGGALDGPVGKSLRRFGGWIANDLAPALRDFGGKVLGGIVEAWGHLNKALKDNGPFLEQMGDGLAWVGRVLTEKVLPFMGEWASVTIPTAGKALGVLVDAIQATVESFLVMVEVGARSFRMLLNAALTTFDGIVSAAAKGMGWIPGLGDKIEDANRAFDRFRDQTLNKLDAIADGARALRDAISAPVTMPVSVRVTGAKGVHELKLLGDSYGGPRAMGGPVDPAHYYKVGERGPEYFRPTVPGVIETSPPAGSGVSIEIGQVVAHDYNDFMHQAQLRAQRAALEGRRPSWA